MKKILFIIFVCCVNITYATNYYFSSVSGDDNRSPSQASNSSTPWKSINKLNSYFSSLHPGDKIFFKRGETFYGSIVINKSGTSSSPITIGAYGSGNRPVITSFVTLSGWKSNSSYSGVYDCAANSALQSQLNMVIINEVVHGMGRYPNANASNKGYLTLESHVKNTSITDNQLSSSPNWKGAEVVIRTSHWTLDRSLITSQSGHTIQYKAASGAYNARDNYGYFIQNNIRTLDQFGEWYYNSSTKRVSMFFGSKTPSAYTVKAATIKNLVYANSKSNIVFDNLTFKGANGETIYIIGGSNITVQNSDIIFSGTDGVNVTGSNFRLENCTVINSNNDGINLGRGSSPVIRNNIVRNSFFIAGMGTSGNGMGVGIKNGAHGLVEYNQVINSGYAGIFLGGDYAIIKNNYIDSFCVLKDDAGGIYTANGNNVTNTGRKIIGNILLHAVGATEGTDNYSGLPSAQGIYMDDNINGVEITGNTVSKCSRGIFLHNSSNIIVKNNTIYDNIYAQLYMKHDALGITLRNHTIKNNIFFAKESSQLSASFNSTLNDIGSIGWLDSNYYARPIDDKLVVESVINLYTSKQTKFQLDVKGWKTKYLKDPASKGSPLKLSGNPDDYVKFVFNASTANKIIPLSGTYVDVKGKKYSNSISLQPYTSAILIKSGSTNASDANKAPIVKITSPLANGSFKQGSRIWMSADASDLDGSISKVAFYNGSTLLHTEDKAPYSYWQSLPAGSYKIIAKATDNEGLQTVSATISIVVKAEILSNSITSNAVVQNVTNNQVSTAPHTQALESPAPKLIDSSWLVDFKLYPNPAVNSINLSFNQLQNYQQGNITIMNMSGMVMKKIPIEISGKIAAVNISSLPIGTYILNLSYKNFSLNKNFIKIK